MALGSSWTQIASKSFTYLGYSGTAYVYAKLNRQDVANNKSYVDLQLRINHSVWVSSYDTDFYLSGYGWLGYAYRSFDAGTTTIMSSQITVNHNNDGTGSFTATGGYEYGGIGVSATQFTSSSQTLPTIPRASVASASPNPLTVGSGGATVTINTNRKSSSFTHDLTLTCGGWSSSQSGIEASTTFTVPYSVIAEFSSTSKTATCTISCVTKNGATTIGTKSSTFTLQVDVNDDHANIGTITLADSNVRTSAVLSAGQFAYGISTLVATIPLTASGSYTELAEAVVTCGNVTQTFSLSGTSQTVTFTFDKVNDSSLSVVVKDKRGNQVTATKTWTLLQYQPITATATVGRPSATGSTAVAQVTGTGYAETYGSTPNSVTIVADFKKHDEVSYHDAETFTESLTGSGADTYTKAITFAYSFDYQKEYDIRFTVTDLFSTAVYYCQLMQGLPILSWDETEVDVWGDLHIHDRSNPTTYQNVFSGLNAILDHSGQKNLLPNTEATEAKSGITYTRNADGSVSCTGTYSADNYHTIGSIWLEAGDYILTGCPSGGGTDDYTLRMSDENDTLIARDDGNGASFTISSAQKVIVRIYAYSNAISGKTFYPMVRDARLASDTYIQYPDLPRIVVEQLVELTVTNGYVTHQYPSGVTYSKYHMPIIQPVYGSGFLTGWTATVQSHTDTSCYIYIRQGTSTPANNSKVRFVAVWIHR